MNAIFRRRALRGILGAVAFVAVAEAVARAGLIDEQVLPPLSSVLNEATQLAGDGEFRSDVQSTIKSWLIGLGLAIVIAVPTGLLLGSLSWLEFLMRPVIEFLRPIPSVAIIPLFLLIFKEELHMQAAAIVYAAAWPMLINTIYGMRDVDPVAKETLRSYGFGSFAVVWRVSLPSTAPFIMTGVRLSAALSLIVAIMAELIGGGTNGIGAYVNEVGLGGDTELMLAATVWAGVLGVLANALLSGAERRLFRWHRVQAGVEAP